MMSDEDLHLIAASFTAILGCRVVYWGEAFRPKQITSATSLVVHGHAGRGLPNLTIHNLFHCTYIPRYLALESASPRDVFDIDVKAITGTTTTVQVTGAHTIAEVKAAVEIQANIPARDQRLLFCGQRLEDHHTISELGVSPSDTIFLLVRTRGGGPEFQLDPNELDPSYNYDFSNHPDDGKTYMRGGKQYKRPYGWKRYAVKVLNVYGSNTWLGPNGIRTEESQGEWPVSYHGTNLQSAKAIMETGYKPGSGQRFTKVGKAIYSSPSLEMVATHYATKFDFKGDTWKVVLQNRVNPDPDHFSFIPANDTGLGAEYWLSPKQDIDRGVFDVRPYGVLLKKL